MTSNEDLNVALDRVFEDAITQLYRSFQKREISRDEIRNWMPIVRRFGLAKVIEEVAKSSEFRRLHGMERQPDEQWSFSQHGETELLLKSMLKTIDETPFVVDVGAAGIKISNSIDFIGTLGWAGLLIEPSHEHATELEIAVSKFDARVVECAVSDVEGEGTLFIGVNPHVSSLERASAESWGPILGEVQVRLRRLGDILSEYAIPNNFTLLTIDAEGLDFRIFNDLIVNTNFRPLWVLIEWGPRIDLASMNDLRISEQVRNHYEIVGQTKSNVVLSKRLL